MQMAFDQAAQKVVLFGGSANSGNINYRDTWEWDGVAWSRVSPNRNPDSYSAGMVWDPVRSRLWMVEPGTPRKVLYYSNREWYQHADWIPGALIPGSAAFHVPSGKVVFHGGQTVLYDGATFTSIANPKDMDHWVRLAYDEVNRVVVGFGGYDQTAPPRHLNQTMVFDGTGWRLLTAKGPSLRTGFQLAWDARRRRIVLYGERTTWPLSTETWEWDGSAWQLAGTGGPLVSWVGMAFDRVRGEMVLFGGSRLTPTGWLYSGETFVRGGPMPYCRSVSYGVGCGSTPTLTHDAGSPAGTVKLDLGSGVPSSIGILLVGTQSLAAVLPRSGCLLHTNPGVLLPIATGSGNGSVTVTIPTGFSGSARLQILNLHAPGGMLDVRSTNGLQTICN